MAIGRESVENLLKLTKPKWRTSITKVEPNRIITRGYPQEDLIGNISFPEMVYLLLKGELPHEEQAKMLESVLVSFCDHGVTPPSTQVARIMASTGANMNTCVSGGISSFGKYHAGALERSMNILQKIIKEGINSEGPPTSSHELKNSALLIVEHFLKKGKKIPGYGHRFHDKDPRPGKLIETAKKYGCFGIHTELAVYIENLLLEMKGIHMNIDGANAGILSDMGFDWKHGTGLFIIGRVPALVSHIYEEKSVESPFRKFVDVEDIYFDGLECRDIHADRNELNTSK
ncbi:citryl-CoA lyase [uncultured Methanobacterium sp.]|uniref:citryl-CoA lyase n=1 Tax=uncultured Methanobacterium sp. TaxID=176306 RepID=UPI002AA86E26|nr:citryl-CoA lyase [uncultured Methanobacterium sp.]